MAVKLTNLENSIRAASRAFHDKERARLEYEKDPFGRPVRPELPKSLSESKMGRPAVSYKVTYEREQEKYAQALKSYRGIEHLEGIEPLDIDKVHHHLRSQKSAAGRIKLDEIGLIEKYYRRKCRHLKELVEKKELPYRVIDESKRLGQGRPKRSFEEVREALEKNIKIQYSCTINKFDIIIQTTLLNQILQNFVQNAIKFTKENSTVQISSYMKDDLIIIDVIDEGIGINESIDLFAPFKRVGNYSGAGLGLFLAKSAADSLGAYINLGNRSDGKVGSIATLALASNPTCVLPKTKEY